MYYHTDVTENSRGRGSLRCGRPLMTVQLQRQPAKTIKYVMAPKTATERTPKLAETYLNHALESTAV